MRRKMTAICMLLFLAASSPFGLGVATARSRPKSDADEYCNQKYMFCVRIPRAGALQPHEGDAPNHGAAVNLPDNSEAWANADWDAVLLGSSRKVLLDRLNMLYKEHPAAEFRIVPTTLAGIPAYHISLDDPNVMPVREEIVIAYSKPVKPDDTGIIYEIGLRCSSQTGYAENIRSFDDLLVSFRLTNPQ